jgi:hypothetical protein
MEAEMNAMMKMAWVPTMAIVAAATTVLGMEHSAITPGSIKIWDAALYDSEECRPDPTIEVACPLYTMRIQGKKFTARIQDECDSQIADSTGARGCTIPVSMKLFHDRWGFNDPALHEHKSMWVEYECKPGTEGSKRLRAFGDESTGKEPGKDITISCG